jgi:hypothetical protein
MFHIDSAKDIQCHQPDSELVTGKIEAVL